MKNILIIGATSAIASACARLWAEQQANFWLVARNAKKLEQTRADLLARGAKEIHAYNIDLLDTNASLALMDDILLQISSLDIALLAHGSLPDQADCQEHPQAALEALQLNIVSPVALLTIIAQYLEKQRHGNLAVISSVAGDRGRPSNYVYGSAKSALSTFAAGLRARMYKAGVNVTVIKPGFVETPMTQELDLPKALLKAPEEIAPRIIQAIEQRKATAYVPWFWMPIIAVIKAIPDFLFKRLTL